MDAVYYLIDTAPQEAKNNLRELPHVTRSGLDEVRRHIHQMKKWLIEALPSACIYQRVR